MGTGAVSGSGTLAFNLVGGQEIDNAITEYLHVIVSAGTVVLSGISTHACGTTINSGATLQPGADQVPLQGTGTLTVNGTLDLAGYDLTVATLAGSATGIITSSVTGTGTLTVGAGTFSGVIQDGEGTIALTKTGTGTLTLTGANTHTGLTTISAGTLQASEGSLDFADVVVTTSGTLVYDGTTLAVQSVAISGSEVYFSWDGIGSGTSTTYSATTSSDGVNFSSLGTAHSGPVAALVTGLERDASYNNVWFVAQDDNGRTIRYQAEQPVATLDLAPASGWYRITSVVEYLVDSSYGYIEYPGGGDVAGVVPLTLDEQIEGEGLLMLSSASATLNDPSEYCEPFDCSWTYADSPQGAVMCSMLGAISTVALPTVGTTAGCLINLLTGAVSVYSVASDHGLDHFTFDINVCPGSASAICRVRYTVTVEKCPALVAFVDWLIKTIDPVYYYDGSIDNVATDLESDATGTAFSQTRSWTNDVQLTATQNNGVGWLNDSLPSLLNLYGGEAIGIVLSAKNIKMFITEDSGATYESTSYVADTLTHNTTNHTFTLADSEGKQYSFYDFDSSVSSELRGKLISITDAGGLVTAVTARTASGDPATVCRYAADGTTVLESWTYSYLQSGDNAGLLESVTLRQLQGATLGIVQQVDYCYYTGTYSGDDAYGNQGDLKTAVTTDADGEILSFYYYRYYTPNDSTDASGSLLGYAHGLKYIFDMESYARLLAALGQSSLTSTAAFSAADTAVADYANHYFQYDNQRRVVRHDIQGAGTFTYAYSVNHEYSDDANTWQYKTVETTPDGSVNVVFCNALGEAMLKVTYDDGTLANLVDADYYEYNSLGARTLEADAAAIASCSVNASPGSDYDVILSETTGAIYHYAYYTSTTATETTAGGATGYFYQSTVQQGTSGTQILLETVTYYARSAGGATAYYTAADTVYTDGTTSTPQTTSYSYTWHSGAVRPATVVVTLATGAETRYTYNIRGEVTETIENYDDGVYSSSSPTEDVKTTYAYDSLGRITSTIGNYVDGLYSSASPDEDVATAYAYDALDRVTRATDALGNVTFYVYDDANREVRVYSGWCYNSTTSLYEPASNAAIAVYREDLWNNYTETLTYVWTGTGQDALPVSATDGSPLGTESLTSAYVALQTLSRSLLNSAGQVVAVREYVELAALAYSVGLALGTQGVHYDQTDFEYGSWGDLVSITDAAGVQTVTTHDALGQVTQIIQNYVDGAYNSAYTDEDVATTYEYDTRGNLVCTTDAAGVATVYTYNYLGQVLGVCQNYQDGTHDANDTADQDVITTYTYDLLGDLLTTTDPAGVVTVYQYNALGQVTSIIQNYVDGAYNSAYTDEDVATTYEYDALGNLVSVTDALGNTTEYAYDSLGRCISVTDALDNVTAYEYDSLGNLVCVIDALDNETQYVYNALGELVSTTDANGDTTSYTYDAVGNLLTLTDAEDNTTTWTYDALGRALTDTNELDATRSYEYDARGNLVEYTDRNGRVIEYEYDALGRETEENWLDSQQNVVSTISYTYDALGQLLSASDNAATYEYEYDALGRLTEQTQTLDGLSPTVVFTYDYNVLGQCTQVSQTLGTTADAVTEYSYDALGRVLSIQQHGVTGGNTVAEKRVDFTYDAMGLYATITTYADLAATDLVATATYSFDDAYQLVGLTYTKDSTTLAYYTYSFDAAGAMASMETVDGTVDYTSDATGQLTAADSDYSDDESYSYDDNGNRVTANGDSYATGDDNQLLSDGTYRYAYDAEGNRIAKFVDEDSDGVLDAGDTDITTYTWDYRDRLTEVATFDDYADYSADESSSVVSYTYDYANRLIGRTFDADGSAGTGDIAQTVYSYDGYQIAQQFDKTYANGSASDLTTTDLSHRYLWNPQAVDHLFADEDVADAELLYALTDHQGSVRDLASYDVQTDVTTIANHRVYDSYGNVQSESNSAVDSLFGYTGRLFDEAVDLQNNLNRWYDAGTGQWMSKDPIGFAAGDRNLYRYVGNKVTSLVDPSGLEPINGPRGYCGLPHLPPTDLDNRRNQVRNTIRVLRNQVAGIHQQIERLRQESARIEWAKAYLQKLILDTARCFYSMTEEELKANRQLRRVLRAIIDQLDVWRRSDRDAIKALQNQIEKLEDDIWWLQQRLRTLQ